ncbi:MAG: hypothetical protein IJ568_06070 [Bacilli bacterium]|nr:hypothetical protein [Bacilli bacterium]
MLIKLIKYDLKSFHKILMFLYILSFFTSLLVLVSKNYGTSDVSIATFLLGTDFSIICMMLTIILPLINVFSKIRSGFYKREGYLMHTLPVKRKTIYDAKMISSLFTIILSWIVFGVCFINVFSGVTVFEYLGAVIDNTKTLRSLMVFISQVGVQFFSIFICSILGMVIGYSFDDKKDFMTFVFGISIYLLLYFIVYLLSLIFNFGNLLILLCFIIFSLILYFIGRYLFDKGVNLE